MIDRHRLEAAKRIIEPRLSPDEKLIWVGRPDPEKFFAEVVRAYLLQLALAALFVPVFLKCSAHELKKRKASPQRRRMMKEIELSNIRYWTEEFRELDVPHPNRLDIDNSRLKPAQTAKIILDHIAKIPATNTQRTTHTEGS